jgi:hypothetical protein
MNAQDKIRHDVETKVTRINADAEKEVMEKIIRERAERHTLPATTNGTKNARPAARRRRSRSRSRKASQGFAHTSGRVSSVEEEDEEEDEGLFIRGGKGEQDDRVVKIRDV